MQRDQRGMLHLQQLRASTVDHAAQQSFQGVGHAAFQGAHALQRHLVGLQQRLCHGIGIGAHQATRAQLHPAEIAHHGGQHALQVLVA